MKSNLLFQNKKILVTGASGFIGSHLCRRLLCIGADVYGVSRKKNPGTEICRKWIRADLSNAEEVKKIFTAVEPSIIFHLASHVVGARDIEYVTTTFRDNLVSTINLLLEASRLNCEHIILTGSLEEPEKTSDFITPSSPYAAAKFASSAYGRLFHALYGTPVSIARLFMVYGPGQLDLKKLIPYTILSLLKNDVPQFTSGHRQVDWIYVEDVVDGLLAMALCPNEIQGQTIDIGSGAQVSVRDLVLQLVTIMKSGEEPAFGSIPDRPLEQIRLADTDATYIKTGWKPKIPLRAGLEQTVAWYRQYYE